MNVPEHPHRDGGRPDHQLQEAETRQLVYQRRATAPDKEEQQRGEEPTRVIREPFWPCLNRGKTDVITAIYAERGPRYPQAAECANVPARMCVNRAEG